MIIPEIFTKIPALAISLTFICPLEKTMVFGAVATGSINPKLAARVAGNKSNSGGS